jgi:peptidoglycan/xylan/chitin deacetylase (PgdA/CDA1 family)
MMQRLIALAALMLTDVAVAAPAACPGNPDALGTERVLTVDARVTSRVGRKQFPATLPLAPKEVVLTFDDGPWPDTTARVLDALRRDCVKATFFLLGQNAAEHPALARRELAEGHTVAHHTFSHPLLDRMSAAAAEAEIDRGIAAVETVLYGRRGDAPATPFFRFPGFASSPVLLERLSRRGIVVFGADLWASDWNPMSPAQQFRLVMGRLDAQGGGIVLFHDTKIQTAAMIPAFLRELKRKGYRVVHVVPATEPQVPPR